MWSVGNIISGASNLKGGENPPYTVEDFKKVYPQFFGEDGAPLVPPEVVDMYVKFAHSCVAKSRYNEAWEVAMSLFIAHFLALYMQTMVDPELDPDAQMVMAAARTKGLVASKHVGDVSYNYDFSSALSDLNGWAAWKLTTFGLQFATMARIYAIGGMYIH